jgi:hypothetical protein
MDKKADSASNRKKVDGIVSEVIGRHISNIIDDIKELAEDFGEERIQGTPKERKDITNYYYSKVLSALGDELKKLSRKKIASVEVAGELVKVAKDLMAASVSSRDVLRGYLEAALWSSDDEDGDSLDSNYGIRDIDGGSLREAKKDVNDFMKKAGDLLTLDGNKGSQIGHDLWLNRNGHGAGFWDGDYPKAGKELDKIASRMGEKYMYVGDDGKVYID